MPFGNKKKDILEDLFSSALARFKKYHPSGNLTFNNSGIFKAGNCVFWRKKSFRFLLSFTPNTLGCYGLNTRIPKIGLLEADYAGPYPKNINTGSMRLCCGIFFRVCFKRVTLTRQDRNKRWNLKLNYRDVVE